VRTQSSPLPARERIAGLVDGSIVLKRESDGSLSLQLTLAPAGPGNRRNSPLLEIGLSDDSARDLSHFLRSDDGHTLRLPCCVGIRAREE
jgi:hypothetical protein